MSDTPRTDAMPKIYQYRSKCSGLVYNEYGAAGDCEALIYVPKEEADKLERELAEKTEELKASRAQAEHYRGLLEGKVPPPSIAALSLVRRLVEWANKYPANVAIPTDQYQGCSGELQAIEQEARRIVEGMK